MVSFATIFGVGLIAGSANSIVEKLIFQTASVGINGESHLFEKPWFMSIVMFAAMLLALPLYYWRSSQRKSERITNRMWYAVFIPSMFDLLGSSFQAIGLVYTPVSVFQMLKGSILIFSAAFSVMFLGRKMYRHHWAGVLICVASLILVGMSSVASREAQTQAVSLGQLLVGIAFIVGGQVVCAAQYVLEEYLLKPPNDVAPMALVGLEGFWGTLAMCFVFLPFMQFWPGADVGGVMENTWDSIEMVQNSPALMWMTASFVLSIFVFNLCGVMVTAQASAVHHTFLDATRTILIWIVSVMMYYLDPAHAFGEPLTQYSWIQAAGFVILLYGECVYDEIVKLPFGLHTKEPVSHLLIPLSVPLVASPAERKAPARLPPHEQKLPLLQEAERTG